MSVVEDKSLDCVIASLALEVLTNSYMNAETIRIDGGIRMPPK